MTAAVVERGQRGVSRVLTKLDNSIEAGNYYEAHQMYRTLYFRYTAQKRFNDCLDLLYNGAMKLVSKQQETSAADLGLLIVTTLEKRGENTDVDEWVERIANVIARLSPSTVERETLINRSIKWSADASKRPLGHANLHKLIAQVFWAEGNTDQARHHFLLCRDGNLCGRILVEIWTTKGFANEIDLFVTQAVLQELSLKDGDHNLRTAEDIFFSYTTNNPHINRKEPPFKQPLLNFTFFLLRCIKTPRLNTFRSLCDLYKISLKRDSSFEKYITKIGVMYFGAQPTPAHQVGGGFMGGMFGDLFSRLFEGLDDEDEGNTENGHVSGNQTNELD